MRPVLFTLPVLNRDVPGYGVMLMIGFLVATWWAARRAARSGANPDVILNCGLIALVAGVVGCRIMYVAHYWEHFRSDSLLDTLGSILNVTRGGLEFYGGFLLTAVAVLAWLRWREKVSLRWYLDIIAPSAALGLAIGRIGCFLNGCCFGTTSELPWALRFPYGSNPALHQWTAKLPGAGLPEELLFASPSGVIEPLPRDFLYASDKRLAAAVSRAAEIKKSVDDCRRRLVATDDPDRRRQLTARLRKLERKSLRDEHLLRAAANMQKYGLKPGELRALAARHRSLPIHPTQLYSSVTALLVALFLDALYWRRRRDGQVVCTLFLIEPASRYILEVIRGDNPVDTLGVFTISQFLAVAMTLAGLIGLLVLRRLPPRSPRARLWEPPDVPPPRSARKRRPARAR